MTAMIKLRHQQPSLWHRGLAEDIEGLWEPWMLLVDQLLEDEQLLDTVYEAQGERHPQSRSRGRMQTPAEVLLRLLLLKHIRNWSYDVLEREVRANLGRSSCFLFAIRLWHAGRGRRRISASSSHLKQLGHRRLIAIRKKVERNSFLSHSSPAGRLGCSSIGSCSVWPGPLLPPFQA